jgi:hypothetical protein
VPTSVGVNAGEAAVPPLNVTAPPTGLPPVEQLLTFGAVVNGPQTEKLTVPVGVGPPVLPVTVAWSEFDSPSVGVEEPGVVEVFELAAVTVKHSVVLPSEEAA